MMIAKYKDKKEIYLLSTIFYSGTVTTSCRGKEVEKPEIVIEYNNSMGGVDLSDSLLSSYGCTRNKVKKFYQKQFKHLIDVTCLNSFIVYKKLGGAYNRLQYHLKLIEEIIEKFPSNINKPIIRKTSTENLLRLVERHFPSYIPSTSKKNCSRKCKVHKKLCDQSRRRKETRFMCRECNVALCATPCFAIYHQERDLNHIDRYFAEVLLYYFKFRILNRSVRFFS